MTTTWQAELDRAIDARFEQMVQLRRHLHQHPEVSGQERETSFLLYQLLGDAGYDVRLGPDGRGVIADAVTGRDAVVPELLALRADMDALRIHDEKPLPYRSLVEGVMHACGHDCHTAIVATVLLALWQLAQEDTLPWPIRLRGLFQPAEETAQGAREMIEVGAMQGVGAILALHVDPALPLGTIGLRSGPLTATADEIEIHVRGRGGHAARPHEASDSIAAAAQFVSSLYLFIPRVTDSRDAVVVTIGQIRGGDTANVIPEEVVLRGTMRTLDREVRAMTIQHIQRLADGIGRTSDTRIEVRPGHSTPSVVNDASWVELLRVTVSELLGATGVRELARPSMGSEDFSYYLDYAPGAMFRLGCTSERAGGRALHAPDFDVDEEALRIGAKIMARAAVTWFDPSRAGSGQPYPPGAQF